MSSVAQLLSRLFPDAVTMDRRERARSVLGAMLGVFVAGMLSQWLISEDAVALWLIAPVGASALLVFAAPASPFAQPWAAIAGNMISAMAGLICATLFTSPLAAAVLAVGLAIILMFLLRCLHPPGGAVALGTALGGAAITKFGWFYPLMPVGLNTALMVLAGIGYNRLCGRRYPHGPLQTKPADAAHLPTAPVGITHDDLDAVLKQYNQILDISRDDLEEILVLTQLRAYHRRFGDLSCGEVMEKDLTSVHFGTDLQEAWRLLQQHDLKALPVVDRFNHVIGLVTVDDFVAHASPRAISRLGPRLSRLLRKSLGSHSEKPEVAGQIMRRNIRIAFTSEPITNLAGLFSSDAQSCVPIVGENKKLEGVLTHAAFINALYASQLDLASGPARQVT